MGCVAPGGEKMNKLYTKINFLPRRKYKNILFNAVNQIFSVYFKINIKPTKIYAVAEI